MLRSQHPPLPSAIRPVVAILRVIGVFAGLAGLAIVVVAVSRGAWNPELAPVVAAALAFAMLGWIHPLSKWFLPALAVCGTLVVVASRSWRTGLLVAGAVSVMFWSQRPGRRLKSRVDPDRITIAESFAVMKNASSFVAEFRLDGFEQVGALQIPIGPINVVASLLLSADGRSYASVTDAIMSVTSLFPDGRSLVTRNSEIAPEPDSVLPNRIPGATPTDLVEAHTQALALLAEVGHLPLTISAPELPQIALANERYAIEWANTRRPRMAETPTGLLLDQPDRHDQIDRWHGGGEVSTNA